MESAYAQFKDRGAGIAIIAAQKIHGMFKGKEHVEQHAYPFPILFDEDRSVTHAYGVYHALALDAYNIARPSTFMVNRDGRICWIAVSPNQHERPQVADLLAAIESCGKY